MSCILICSKEEKERMQLKEVSKEFIAYTSDERLEIQSLETSHQLSTYLLEKPLLDAAYLDVTIDGGILAAEKVSKENSTAALLIIADETISPIMYMKPAIMAASLLLRPITKGQADTAVKEILSLVFHKEKTEEVFIIDNREGKVRVPYDRICYFEARDKKIFVCLESKEYGFYETMGKLEEQLPEHFLRCHRGFIVNTRKIEKVNLTKNEIVLVGQMAIPISRSYRNLVKEVKY